MFATTEKPTSKIIKLLAQTIGAICFAAMVMLLFCAELFIP